MSGYRVVIADDHPLFRGALRETLAKLFPQAGVLEVGTFDELQSLIDRDSAVDLVLLDLTMPGARGFSGLMYLRGQYPQVPVIVVSANTEPGVIRPLHGVRRVGLHPQDREHRADAHRHPQRAGGRRLGAVRHRAWRFRPGDQRHCGAAGLADPRSRCGLLMMLSEGLLNKQIAHELSVSEATVKAHVSAILQKLGVESRTQAVITAAKIELPQWAPQGAAH